MSPIDLLHALGVVGVAILLVRAATGRSATQKDPQRDFTPTQRAEGFARARNQCEHVTVFGRRCTNAPTHGDHHYPHSKGGATTLSNFVALCARHNLTKGNRVPTHLATRRLERHRRTYFPPGARVDIVWRVGGRR